MREAAGGRGSGGGDAGKEVSGVDEGGEGGGVSGPSITRVSIDAVSSFDFEIDSTANLASDGLTWSSSATATSLMLPPSDPSATSLVNHRTNAINHTLLRNSYDGQLTMSGVVMNYRKHVWRLAGSKAGGGGGDGDGGRRVMSLALLQYIHIGEQPPNDNQFLLGIIKVWV